MITPTHVHTKRESPGGAASRVTITTGDPEHPLTTVLTRGGVTRLPRDVYKPLAGRVVQQNLMAFLLSRRNRKTGVIPPLSRDVIAAGTGYSPRTISTAIAAAVAAGVLKAKQLRRRAPYTFTVITDPHSFWEEIPNGFFVDAASGDLTGDVLQVWLYLDRALGTKKNWTNDTPAKIAAEFGISERAVRRKVAVLARAGMVIVTDVRDGKWNLRRPVASMETDTPEPAETPEPPLIRAQVEEATDHHQLQPDGTTSCNPVVHAPVVPAPEYMRVSVRRTAHLSDARASAPPELRSKEKPPRSIQSKHPRPPRRAGIETTRADVGAVMAGLTPELLTGPARRWRPGIASKAVAPALDRGMSIDAALTALNTLTDLDAEWRQIPAAKAALDVMARDIRMGLACQCGTPSSQGHTAACPRGAILSEAEQAAITEFWALKTA